MEVGVLWNDKCMLTLKNEQNRISWGDNFHIIDHKKNLTYACNDYNINIIIAKDFLKILKTVNVLWFFIKSQNKNSEIGVHLTSKYKLYSGMHFRTILSSSFKSRTVRFLLQPPF